MRAELARAALVGQQRALRVRHISKGSLFKFIQGGQDARHKHMKETKWVCKTGTQFHGQVMYERVKQQLQTANLMEQVQSSQQELMCSSQGFSVTQV